MYDGIWAASGPPSGRNVVRSVLKAWIDIAPEDEIWVLCKPGEGRVVRETFGAGSISLRTVEAKSGQHLLSILTHSGSYDATFTQNFVPPFVRAHSKIVLIHDLIYKDSPDWFTRRERAYLSPLLPLARGADVVITTSKSEAKRIEKYLPRTPITPVGLGLHLGLSDSRPKPPVGVNPQARFLLIVGRLNERKNLERVLRAVDDHSVLAGRQIYIAGSPDGLHHKQSASSQSLRYLGYVTDDEMAWLYGNCDLVVFGSLDEGFGMPVAEAAHFGAPIALSDIAVFRELDPGASFFDPRDERSISQVVSDALREARPCQAKVPTWNTIAHNIRSEAARA